MGPKSLCEAAGFLASGMSIRRLQQENEKLPMCLKRWWIMDSTRNDNLGNFKKKQLSISCFDSPTWWAKNSLVNPQGWCWDQPVANSALGNLGVFVPLCGIVFFCFLVNISGFLGLEVHERHLRVIWCSVQVRTPHWISPLGASCCAFERSLTTSIKSLWQWP